MRLQVMKAMLENIYKIRVSFVVHDLLVFILDKCPIVLSTYIYRFVVML